MSKDEINLSNNTSIAEPSDSSSEQETVNNLFSEKISGTTLMNNPSGASITGQSSPRSSIYNLFNKVKKFTKPTLETYKTISDITNIGKYLTNYIPLNEKSKMINNLKTRYNKSKRPFQKLTSDLEKKITKSNWASQFKNMKPREIKKLPFLNKVKYSIANKLPKALHSLRQGANTLPKNIGKALKFGKNITNKIATPLNLITGAAEVGLASPEERTKTTYKVVGRFAGDALSNLLGLGVSAIATPAVGLSVKAASSLILPSLGEKLGENIYKLFHKKDSPIRETKTTQLYFKQSNAVNPLLIKQKEIEATYTDMNQQLEKSEIDRKELLSTDTIAQAFITQLTQRFQNTCIS